MPENAPAPDGATAAGRDEPATPLAAGTLAMWRLEALVNAAVLVVAASALGAGVEALMPWLPLVAAVAGLAYAAVVPPTRFRRWRWALRDEELALVHGVWRITRTIVPLTRIQHVSVERTGWTDLFSLVRVHVHTAAGTTTIPGLERARADDVRDRILARLRTPDDL
ncbi:MAG TPA: PH domain-containing protein [Solirubrobacteraceae bacterium]|nr:PH domain-containing protein [Solirubrobacteraceae bacterium]